MDTQPVTITEDDFNPQPQIDAAKQAHQKVKDTALNLHAQCERLRAGLREVRGMVESLVTGDTPAPVQNP